MKKSILILTDRSANALHASDTAMMLAGRLGKNLILLNCNNTISGITYLSSQLTDPYHAGYEERKSALEAISHHMKEQFKKRFPDQRLLSVDIIIRDGDVQANVADVLPQHNISLIVMGSRSDSVTGHLLFGSDTKNVVDHSPVPVLIVSGPKQIKPIIKLTFATNFLEQDTAALDYLLNLSKQLEAKLEIVHIKQYGVEPRPKSFSLEKKIEQACAKNPESIVYREVYGKNVAQRLQRFCKENNSDILVLSYQYHSVLFRVLKQSTVEWALSSHRISLLVIPNLTHHQQKSESSSTKHSELLGSLTNIVF